MANSNNQLLKEIRFDWNKEEILKILNLPLIDLMWVVDDSGSMNTFQSHLSTNMQLFMNIFLSDSG